MKTIPSAMLSITDNKGNVYDLKIQLNTAELDSPETIKNALYNACSQYIKTERGKSDYEYCGKAFNYKFVVYKLPEHFCAKEGFQILSSELKVAFHL